MGSNSIGKEFCITCFGESHGKCVGVVIDGCPAGLYIELKDIQEELDKRIPPDPEIVSPRKEEDKVEILSGIFNGYTTGAPILAIVWNKEAKEEDYEFIKNLARPSHADYPARVKYGGFNDYRGGGRFSGRITLAFVIAGAIAKKLLKTMDIEVIAHTVKIGNIELKKEISFDEIKNMRYKSPVRCVDLELSKKMKELILKAKLEGDSVGGIVECIVINVPIGVGEPIFDSLDADIAKIMFNIPAVKGVEFGAGFKVAELKGSENNDPYTIKNGKIITLSNNAGGIIGGLSTGMPIKVRVAFKPPSSIFKEQKTVDLARMEETSIKIKGRHDVCIVPKAIPVVEGAMAIVLVDHLIRGGFLPKVLKRI
ncbi:MAG: chorismate synthase [Candidatus Bathyarchaeia archaeon]